MKMFVNIVVILSDRLHQFAHIYFQSFANAHGGHGRDARDLSATAE